MDPLQSSLNQQICRKAARHTSNFPWPWMGLTPRDEPLVLKDTGTEEIYSFDWETP